MKWHLVVVALAATFCIEAQAPPVAAPKPAGESKDAKDGKREGVRTLERAQSMREQIDAGRPVKSHVRVAVRLKNGNKLSGVVKDGQLVERIDGLRFVEAQAQETGAGIRLWYATGARNYVFVPFADFNGYQILQRLSQKQIDEIERDMQMEESRRAEREAAQARKVVGKVEPSPAQAEEGDGTPRATPEQSPKPVVPSKTEVAKDGTPVLTAAEKAELERQRLWFSLMQDYPSTAGWGATKRDEISNRMVVIGAKPSDKEQRFVDQFAEWQKACEHFAVKPEAKPAEQGAEATKDYRSKSKDKSK
ncbi:MAG: hypothetical protein ABIP94_11700 [Planctomycetota bacterium]